MNVLLGHALGGFGVARPRGELADGEADRSCMISTSGYRGNGGEQFDETCAV